MDVAWILYIGMNKLGYTEEEVYLMQFGKWIDLFETYKVVYNFESAGGKYQVDMEKEEEKSGSVFDL